MEDNACEESIEEKPILDVEVEDNACEESIEEKPIMLFRIGIED